MNKKYTIDLIIRHTMRLLLIATLLLSSQFSKASHLVGGDMSYQCLGGRQYYVVFKVYRNCDGGIELCTCPGGPAPCSRSINVVGLDGICSGVTLANALTLNIDPSAQVSGFDVIQLCASQKTVCTNCGTRSPGSFTPGIEVYTFNGVIDLSSVPTSCCNVSVGWTDCCRNAQITNLVNPSGLSYYVGAQINLCANPCSSAPVFTNDPVAIVCSGQEFLYNLGAVDPDGDSLSFGFGTSLVAANTPAQYKNPYNGTNYPFPYLGAPNFSAPAPLGINVDPITGDVRFTPNGNFVSNFVVEVTQWRYGLGGAPYKVGVTRRDIQFYSITTCPPNEVPKILTYDVNGALKGTGTYPSTYMPQTNWSVCAKNKLCIIFVARDGYDSNDPVDTTDESWNAPSTITSPTNGTYTWTRLYQASQRGTLGPKFDSFMLCWTPGLNVYAKYQGRPIYFTVTGKDRACPVPARNTRSFSIVVNQTPDATIAVDSSRCGTYRFKYTLKSGSPSVNPAYTRWYIETAPGSGSYYTKTSDPGAQDKYTHKFLTGGHYNMYIRLSSYPPPNPGGCPNDSIPFSVDVPNNVRVSMLNWYNCDHSSVKVTANGIYGVQGQNRFTYFINGAGNSRTIVRAKSSDSNAVLLPPSNGNTAPYTTTYTVMITDPQQGCIDSTPFTVLTRALPDRNLLPKIRVCKGVDTAMWADGINPTTKNASYKWYKMVNKGIDPVTGNPLMDTMLVSGADEFYSRWALNGNDSGTFVLIKTDKYGCQQWDTTQFKINSFPISGGANQVACLGDPPLTMRATIPTGATVTGIGWYNTKAPSTLLSDKDTLQVPSNKIGVDTFVIVSSNTFDNVSCNSRDTITASVNPVPILKPITPQPVCIGSSILAYPKLESLNTKGIRGAIWTYPKDTRVITTKNIQTQYLVDIPASTGNNPYANVLYYTAIDSNGCRAKGAFVVAVYPASVINLQPSPFTMCDYNLPINLNQKYSNKFNTNNYPELWTGRGVSSQVIAGNTVYFFDPAAANVRKGLPVDTNILSYNYSRVFPGSTPLIYQNDTISIPGYSYPKTASSPTAGCPSGDTIVLAVVKTPKVNVDPGPAICNSDDPIDLNLHFNASSTAPDPSTAKWYFKNPPAFPTNAIKDSTIFVPQDPDIQVPVGSQKVYKLYYRDISTGCLTMDSVDMVVNGSPLVKIDFDNPTDAHVCQSKGSVKFILQPKQADWSTGDIATLEPTLKASGTLTLPNAVTINPDDATLNLLDQDIRETVYRFTYNYKNGSTGCYNKSYVDVDVQLPPVVQLFDDKAACEYNTNFDLEMVIKPAFPYGFQWGTNGTGTINNATSDKIQYIASNADKANGAVKFWATSTNNRICPASSDTGFVILYKQPVADFTCDNCSGCVSEKYGLQLTSTFTSKPTGVSNPLYFWFINGKWANDTFSVNTDNVFGDTMTQSGTHSVVLYVASQFGCLDTSATATVTAYSTPVPAFEPNPRYTTIAKPYFDFNNKSFNPDGSPVTYTWYLGGLTPDEADRVVHDVNPTHIKYSPDTSQRKITLIVQSDKGCIDSVSDYIRINPDITLFIPSAFSPNATLDCPGGDDNCNRSFKVVVNGQETIDIFVYNRWGQKVFETHDPNIGWNGKLNNEGADCQQDAYIYQITALSYSGKKYLYSGSITLLR